MEHIKNNMNQFNFENPHQKSQWIKALEFRGDGLRIKPISWDILKAEEGNPPAKYVNNKGYTYRLTLEETDDKVRYYENKWDSFANSMKNNGIKPNIWGILINYQDENGRWQWKWEPEII